ncbi:hypothetical protein [Nonomuraea sp. NPDC001699]
MTNAPATTPGRSPALMLTLATLGFAVNFWAWALLSPLGPRFKELLGLSAGQQALLVAVPVIVGSLGRIPVGALTDRFGGRVMFPLVSAATIVPVLFTGLVGAAGGLGGFVPPLVMGFLYGRLGSYGVGLGLLAATAVLTLALTVTAVRALAARRVAGPVASRRPHPTKERGPAVGRAPHESV